jgi:hypothetical protein
MNPVFHAGQFAPLFPAKMYVIHEMHLADIFSYDTSMAESWARLVQPIAQHEGTEI